MEQIAAHCESCSSWCSNTMRTARSRSSCGYLVDLVMAPSSQGLEPPRFPTRFKVEIGPEPEERPRVVARRVDQAGRISILKHRNHVGRPDEGPGLEGAGLAM